VINEARLRLRQVQRAASDLRRGVPVVLGGDAPLAILSAETADASGLAEFASLSDRPMLLLLAPGRAAAILPMAIPMDAPVIAVPLPDGPDKAGFYRALADATLAQDTVPGDLGTVAPPPFAAAAIQLAKIGQLLPAVLAKPLAADIAPTLRDHGMVQVAAADIQGYGDYETASLRHVSSAAVPLIDAPDSRIVAFRTHASALEHYAILVGQPEQAAEPLVRIHSCCFTGDLLGSMRCDCGDQLRGAIRRMADDGSGVLLYLAQEGRGIGLVNKLRAYELQDRGLDTMDANRALGWGADERNFLTGASMLQSLGIKRIRLLTNNPDKMAALSARGIEVVGREAHLFEPNGVNDEYLATKASRFGHMLD
jgi:GTP cyclohydrolase II